MRLFTLQIHFKGYEKVNKLAGASDVASFGYFQRSSVKEFLDFTCKLIIERTGIAQRSSVKEQEYMCHTYVRSDSLSAVLVADHEYPQRVAHTLLTKILDEFSAKYPPSSWPGAAESAISFPQCEEFLTKYQNPREADAMTKIQQDLDETKIILHNTIEAVLERGEKLDDLVEKSEAIGMQSKAFYKTARKANSCCVIL